MCTEERPTCLTVRTPDRSRLKENVVVATEFFCLGCGASLLLGYADETPNHLCRSQPPRRRPPNGTTAN